MAVGRETPLGPAQRPAPPGAGSEMPASSLSPGMNVQATAVGFEVGRGHVQTPTGPRTVVTIWLEHGTGSTKLMIPPELAASLGQALLKAATGIEIVTGR